MNTRHVRSTSVPSFGPPPTQPFDDKHLRQGHLPRPPGKQLGGTSGSIHMFHPSPSKIQVYLHIYIMFFSGLPLQK